MRRTPWFALLVVGLAGVAYAQEKAADPSPPKRRAESCAEIRKDLEEAGKSYNVKVKPGSWGKVPKELQKLPPGGEFCGIDSTMGQAIIKTALFGKDLEAYYAPLFEIGCKPVTCDVVQLDHWKQTRCKCRRPGGVGAATTNVSNESISLGVL